MDIDTMVREHNADYMDEIGPFLADTTPVISVKVHSSTTGWEITVVSTVGLVDGNGDFIVAAEDPRVLASNQRLPRWAAKDTSKFAMWLVNKAYGKDHGLTVEIG